MSASLRPKTCLTLLSLLSTVGSCSAAETIPVRVASESAHAWRDAEGSQVKRMLQIAERLRGHGFVPSQSFEGFLVAPESRTFSLPLQSSRCWIVVAYASGGLADIDAAYFLPSGVLVGEDEQPDPHPSLAGCIDGPNLDGYYRLSAYRGAGAFLVVAFSGASEDFRLATGSLLSVPGELERPRVDPILGKHQEVVAGAMRRGFRSLTPDRRFALGREPVYVPLRTRVGSCYTIVSTRMDTTPGDFEVKLVDSRSRSLFAGSGDSVTKVVQLCAGREDFSRLELSSRGGTSRLIVTMLHVPEVDLGGHASLWHSQRAGGLPSLEHVREEPQRSMAPIQPRQRVGRRQLGFGVLQPGESRMLSLSKRPDEGCIRLRAIGEGVDGTPAAVTLRPLADRTNVLAAPNTRHRCAGDSTRSEFMVEAGSEPASYRVEYEPIPERDWHAELESDLRTRALEFISLHELESEGEVYVELVSLPVAEVHQVQGCARVTFLAGAEDEILLKRDAIDGPLLANTPSLIPGTKRSLNSDWNSSIRGVSNRGWASRVLCGSSGASERVLVQCLGECDPLFSIRSSGSSLLERSMKQTESRSGT
ncbi:MAG: hypothetical protein AAF355_09520 [Myxococcota bacterium]